MMRIATRVLVAFAVALPATAAVKPNIKIVATGGTIAGAATGQSAYGYKAGAVKAEDLIKAAPGIDKLAVLSSEQVANIGSQDMNDKVWLKLAHRVNELLASPEVDGVVITHGTDTMEETAYFLDLVVRSDKPVILVGSMRPATSISADGPMNLYDAVAVAADRQAKGRGVLVVLDDQIHAARNVEKTNTTSLGTFKSGERGAAGVVHTGKIQWFNPVANRHTTMSEFSVANKEALPRVDVIYAHANMSPDLIKAAVEGGAKGVVIAGVGNGNMTQEVQDLLANLAKQGTVVVRSTRLESGVVLRNDEINDDKQGFVASGEFNPAKSRVLLQLALTKTQDPKQIQRMFNEY
jgi:L-asparaginase